MDKLQKRFVLFLIGCIGTRVLLAYLAKVIDLEYLPLMGIGALVIGIGFIYIYITGSRKTGVEVGGGRIWWNQLRPIHGALYLIVAYYAINKQRVAWKFLAIDVVIGLIAFLTYHYSQGNFKKIL